MFVYPVHMRYGLNMFDKYFTMVTIGTGTWTWIVICKTKIHRRHTELSTMAQKWPPPPRRIPAYCVGMLGPYYQIRFGSSNETKGPNLVLCLRWRQIIPDTYKPKCRVTCQVWFYVCIVKSVMCRSISMPVQDRVKYIVIQMGLSSKMTRNKPLQQLSPVPFRSKPNRRLSLLSSVNNYHCLYVVAPTVCTCCQSGPI